MVGANVDKDIFRGKMETGMSTDKYIITKRTECDNCSGHGYWILSADDIGAPCSTCNCQGYTETRHDFDEVLLSRLAKLQFALVTVTGDYENERQSLWDLEFKD